MAATAAYRAAFPLARRLAASAETGRLRVGSFMSAKLSPSYLSLSGERRVIEQHCFVDLATRCGMFWRDFTRAFCEPLFCTDSASWSSNFMQFVKWSGKGLTFVRFGGRKRLFFVVPYRLNPLYSLEEMLSLYSIRYGVYTCSDLGC